MKIKKCNPIVVDKKESRKKDGSITITNFIKEIKVCDYENWVLINGEIYEIIKR